MLSEFNYILLRRGLPPLGQRDTLLFLVTVDEGQTADGN